MGWFDRPEFGPNVGLIDDVYRQYLDDPTSVSEAWREFFAEHEPDEPEDEGPTAAGPSGTPATEARAPEPPATERRADQADQADRGATRGEERAEADGAGARTQARTGPQPSDKRPAATEGTGGRDQGPTDGAEPLRGAAARIVQAMEANREGPTANSFRVLPARLLEVNRDVLNGHLRRRRGGKVSFTHLIGYAVVKAVQVVPAMSSIYVERDGKPHVRR